MREPGHAGSFSRCFGCWVHNRVPNSLCSMEGVRVMSTATETMPEVTRSEERGIATPVLKDIEQAYLVR